MKKNSQKFKIFEHTADIGLEIYGKDLGELFINAASGLFGLITDLKKVSTYLEKKINLREDNREELFVSWLNELIFQFSARGFIPKKFKINKITDNIVSSQVFGEKINLSKHKILTEIKAATYHELEIKEARNGLVARVIFDI